MLLLLVILLPLGGALLPSLVRESRRGAMAALAALPPAIALGIIASLGPRTLAGSVHIERVEWAPSLGLSVALRLDGLSLLFAGLILGIGLLVILYARYYLDATDAAGRFFGKLLFFMAAMLGVALAENLIFLAVFWEMTSISSFLLIGYWSHKAEARRGARLALTLTAGGGLMLLAGLLLLGHIAGSYELAEVLTAKGRVQSHPLFPLTLVLILLGAFTKSAQFPFHFWLPHAMAAPTPVSAYLHSATMVKAGIFLLARLHPALSGGALWFWLVAGVGMTTMVVGAYHALLKHDTKALLAYSTVSHLGLLTALFGFGTPAAAVVGVFHLLNHAAFKASLFMVAGIVDHEAGTRDIRLMGGLRKLMPVTALFGTVAAAAMAGIPPFNGFISKEMFLEQTLALPHAANMPWLLPAVATLGSLLSVGYSVRFAWEIFFGQHRGKTPKVPHDPPLGMQLPVALMVTLCLFIGLLPTQIVEPLLGSASAAVIGAPPPAYVLGLWHGLNTPLLMSALAVGLGVLWYKGWPRLEELHQRLPRLSGKAMFEASVKGLVGFAERVTQLADNGSLQRYIALLLTTALVLGASPFFKLKGGVEELPRLWTPPDAVSVFGISILIIGVIAVVRLHRSRFKAIIALSMVGLMVTLAFAKLSGTDLALTQISVEVTTILLLLIVLYLLPQKSTSASSKGRRARDATLALLSGAGAAGLSFMVMTTPPEATLSEYFLAKSKPEGGGTNVVNVILVDFRGFDTMGEIAVLGMAALGIVLLLGTLQMPHSAVPRTSEVRYPVVLQMISRPLLPLIIMMSIYLLMRGHNLPGGGFIGGLVTAIALVLQYLASGIDWVSPRMKLDYQLMIALGVILACLVGLASLAFGAPFLTSTFTYVEVPLLGKLELASAMVFDVGVYVCVVGAVMLALTNLDYLSRDSVAKDLNRPEQRPWKR